HLRHQPLAVHARAARSGRLLRRTLPRHLRIPRPRARSAVEREVHGRTPELSGVVDPPRGLAVGRRRCEVSNPVTFALVGGGGIAQSYADAFKEPPDARLIAVADVRAEAAAAIAAKFGCPSFASYQELLANGPRAEAVVICTPPNTHEELTTAFAA